MHQMSFGCRAPPGPAGGAYSASPDPLAALKLLASSALNPRLLRRLASRRSETERSGSSFFPIRTLLLTYNRDKSYEWSIGLHKFSHKWTQEILSWFPVFHFRQNVKHAYDRQSVEVHTSHNVSKLIIVCQSYCINKIVQFFWPIRYYY